MEPHTQTACQALEDAYEAHRVAVYHTALSYVKDRQIAEDISQEVFLSLYREWEKGTNIRHLQAWLLTATRHRCMNHLRDSRWEEPTEDESAVWEAGGREDDAAAVRELLERLPREERLVFCLHCLDGYSYRELSEGLALPIGTVQTRVRAARKRLKKWLKEEDAI